MTRCARTIVDAAVLERLAQRLERRPRELGQLVEEQDAVVGEGRLARARLRAAADQAGRPRSCGAARGTGARSTEPAAAVQAGDAVDARDLDRLARASAAAGATGSRRASIVLPVPGRAVQEAGCGRRPRRPRAPGSARCGRGRRRGRARRGRRTPAARRRSGGIGAGLARRRAGPPPPPAGARRRAPRAGDERRLARAVARDARAARARARRAPSAIASAPRTGAHARRRATARRRPRSPSSASASSWPLAASTATASGRSKPGPTLRRYAGARLIVMRSCGNSKPEFDERGADALARLAHGLVGEPDDGERGQARRGCRPRPRRGAPRRRRARSC